MFVLKVISVDSGSGRAARTPSFPRAPCGCPGEQIWVMLSVHPDSLFIYSKPIEQPDLSAAWGTMLDCLEKTDMKCHLLDFLLNSTEM